MDQYRQLLDRALRRGEQNVAMDAARAWIAQSDQAAKDTAIEIARTAGAVYRDFISRPVEQFVEDCNAELPGEYSTLIDKALNRLIGITREWEGRVRACYEERLARELRDFVRAKNFAAALENVGRLVQPSERLTDETEKAEDSQRRAIYVANVLGTCLNHPRETDQLLQMIWRKADAMGLTPEIVQGMKAAKDERHAAMMSANVENLELQWTTTLRETQVEILNRMPGKNLMGEPEESELRDVGDVFRSVLRVPLELKQYRILIDATLILVDFLPKETAAVAKASGIEARSYEQLGFRGRKAVAMTFMEIGKVAHFANFYLEFTKRSMDSPYLSNFVEFMGALRNPAYEQFFVELWESREHKALRNDVATALGNLASPKAAEFMLEELRAVLEKKPANLGEQFKRLNEWKVSDKAMDPATVKRAEKILQALGRVLRSPRADDAIRRRVMEGVMSIVPQDDRRLGQAVAVEIMAAKPDALAPQMRRWAVQKLTDALWVQDQATEMHKGGERQENILGARGNIVAALKRLGQADPDAVIAAASEQVARYSGAYIAAAAILEELPDPRVVNLLSSMLLNAATHDEGRQNIYQQETYWDATEQRRKPLTRDKVMATLVEALGTVGSREAIAAIEELGKRIQMGGIIPPGPETVEAMAKYMKLPAPGAPSGVTPTPPRTPGATPFDSTPGFVPDVPAEFRSKEQIPAANPAEVKELVKTLTGSYLLVGARKKAEKKIQALVRLGQLTPPEALGPIFDQLVEKDSMIVSAALTTLAEYASPGKPEPLVNSLMDELEQRLVHRDPEVRGSSAKLIKELGPSRPAIKKRLVEMARRVDRTDSRKALQEAVGQAVTIAPPVSGLRGGSPAPVAGGVAGPRAPIDALDAKRQYMIARKAWIDGGKKGPAPEPPA